MVTSPSRTDNGQLGHPGHPWPKGQDWRNSHVASPAQSMDRPERDVRSTKKAKCFREIPCPGSGGDRAPTGAASPSPGESECGKGWNLIRVTINPSYRTPASRVSLVGKWGAAPPRNYTFIFQALNSASHSCEGASGETEVEAGIGPGSLRAYVCVSMARPRPCSRGGI